MSLHAGTDAGTPSTSGELPAPNDTNVERYLYDIATSLRSLCGHADTTRSTVNAAVEAFESSPRLRALLGIGRR